MTEDAKDPKPRQFVPFDNSRIENEHMRLQAESHPDSLTAQSVRAQRAGYQDLNLNELRETADSIMAKQPPTTGTPTADPKLVGKGAKTPTERGYEP